VLLQGFDVVVDAVDVVVVDKNSEEIRANILVWLFGGKREDVGVEDVIHFEPYLMLLEERHRVVDG
jgi:hypothetical protein